MTWGLSTNGPIKTIVEQKVLSPILPAPAPEMSSVRRAMKRIRGVAKEPWGSGSHGLYGRYRFALLTIMVIMIGGTI